MKKHRKWIILLTLFVVLPGLLFYTGCTPLTTVNDQAVQNLRKDLMGSTSSIKTVKVTTWGPWGEIDVYFSDKPPQEITDAVFERVKDFALEDNLASFNQPGHLDLYLSIYTNGEKENPSIEYSSSYYNSNDMTDDSPSNVNGYKTWKTWTSPSPLN